MAYVPYVSAEDFQNFSWGVDLSTLTSTEELNAILVAASQLCERYCRTSFQYQVVQNELHDWPANNNTQRWEVFPKYSPIRTVTQFNVNLSLTGQGSFVPYKVVTTPVDTTSNPPLVYGNTFVDRNRGFVQTVDFMIGAGFLGALPGLGVAAPLRPAQISISYTSGFDPPTLTPGAVGPDGLNFPVPQSLIEATRITAAAIIGERALGQQGMIGVELARQGPTQIRRGTGALGGSEFSLPMAARMYLTELRIRAVR